MTRNAVVTPHLLSAQAARTILDNGGNAVDAAVAAVAAQGVVAPETCGIGGDLFALVHSPGWAEPRALNSSGRAGSGVDAEELRRAGLDSIPTDHVAAVTVPGCIDGLATLADDLGRLELGESLGPAIALAANGFEVSTEQAAAFGGQASVYASHPAVADFYPGGTPVRKGQTVRRQDLANTLETVAAKGRSGFYGGKPAEDIVEATGGSITTHDLERPIAEWIDPLPVAVGGLTAWTIPPNSQGYLAPSTLAVLEMLGAPNDPEDPLSWHLLIESYRALAWERDDLVADPDHAPVPPEVMVAPERLARVAQTISHDTAGTWPKMGPVSGTAYLCVADRSGLSVSIIQSNYRGTGSPHGARRSGFLLQDRGLGFGLMPGHPNELAPGKRPLHTLSPTLWTDGTSPRWILGTRGGAVQPQLLAQVARRAIVGDASLEEAQRAPRWTVSDFGPHTEPKLQVEPAVTREVVSGLTKRGHMVEVLESPQGGWGPVSIIELDGSVPVGAANDPRVDTSAALLW